MRRDSGFDSRLDIDVLCGRRAQVAYIEVELG